MVKLQGPLFSQIAHGSIGKVLTFAFRTRRHIVRFQRGQKDYLNSARAAQRGYFQTAVGWWHELTAAEQYEWHSEGQADC